MAENLQGKRFSSLLVIKDTGKQKVACRCDCGVEKEISRYSLLNGKTKSCGGAVHKGHAVKVGDKFNHWTVIEDIGSNKLLCKCECGIEKICDKYTITHGKSKSCGCKKSELIEKGDRYYSLQGKKFGKLTVINDTRKQKVACRCDCGTEKEVDRYHLVNGDTISCGCYQYVREDLTGQKFYELTVIKELHNNEVLCRCSCGIEKVYSKYQVKNGFTKSCGCKSVQFKSESLIENLVGKQFNEWTIIEELGHGKVKCRCSCGEIRVISKASIKNGTSKSCGHKHSIGDLVGRTFGKWEVLKDIGYGYAKCRCSCGTVSVVQKTVLINGLSKSCGCAKIALIQETLLNRYGELTANKVENPREKWQIDILNSKDKLKEFIGSQFETKPTIQELAKVLSVNEATMGRVIKNYELKSSIDFRPIHSQYELEIEQFLRSICNDTIVKNTRDIISPKELDIYIPERSIAIEFNGDYWHSENVLNNKKYHQVKSIECMKKNIRLIHIFEYEWKSNKEKIKQYIKNILLDKVERVYARNTEIKRLSVEEEKVFLNENHMQGYVKSSIAYGLAYKGEIIGIMTFGVPRFDTKYQYELLRLAFKNNIRVVGGAEKLFKHFISEYKPISILSYCNIAKFTGAVYRRLGFSIVNITEPNYVWVDSYKNNILTRYQTQKHKLIEKGLGNESQTEDEIMTDIGYLKVYDSGNIKFEWIAYK